MITVQCDYRTDPAVTSASWLTECVASPDEGDGLSVIHAHAGKDVADVRGAAGGHRVAHEAVGVDVDQT